MIDPDKYYNVAVIYHQHRYPDYTYVGTVTASNSAYEGGTDMYYIGLAGSIPMTYSNHQSNSYSASLVPTRISITPGRNEAYWYLDGEAHQPIVTESMLPAVSVVLVDRIPKRV